MLKEFTSSVPAGSALSTTAPDWQINVVLIPSYDSPHPRQWKTQSESWLDVLFNARNFPAKIWQYHHARPLSDSPCLEQILSEGYNLLSDLAQFCRDEQRTRKCPLFFVCHSLGGTILKKALCAARERWTEYLELINLVSGILLLASPHLRAGTVIEANVIENILRTNEDFTNFKRAWTDRDNLLLEQLCTEFEKVKVQVPIISAFETQETKIYRIKRMFSRFQNAKSAIVIGKSLSQVKSTNEVQVEVKSDFRNICSIEASSALYVELKRVLTQVSKASKPAPIEKSVNLNKNLDAISLRSYSTFDLSAKTPPTNEVSSKSGDPATGQGTANSSQPTRDYEVLPMPGFEVVKRNPKIPQFSVPLAKNEHFRGRVEVLDNMRRHLSTKSQASVGGLNLTQGLRVFTLSGMPGIGKTSTAVEYVYRHKHEYDAIFWLHSEDENILSKEFTAIAGILELEDSKAQTDLNASRDLVKGWLSKPYKTLGDIESDANWLIVFDNVEDLELIREREYWPELGQGSIIITSRDPMVKSQIPMNSIGEDLGVFSTDQTVQLIRDLAGKETQEQTSSLQAIAENIGGLPLAIQHLAGMRSNLRLSYLDLARMYSTLTGSSRAILSSQLGLQTLSKAARSLVDVMSLLDPDEIPEQILRPGFESVIMDDFPQDEMQYYLARATLLKSSLVSCNEKTEHIGMHRVVRDVTRSMMTKEQTKECLKIAFDLVSRIWPFQDLRNRYDTSRWPKCERYFPSIVRLRAVYEQVLSTELDYQPPDSVAELLNDAGWYWFERGFSQESKKYFQLAQAICEKSPNKSTDKLFYTLRETHNNLASVYADTNETEDSLRHTKIWMSMSEARKAADGNPIIDYELGIVYNETGVAYGMNREYAVAEIYFIKAIETFRGLENYDDTMLGWPEPNLGFMYWMQGKYEQAEQVLLEILEIHANEFGYDDVKSFKTGKILYALGNVYESKGDLDQAFSYHKRCFNQYLKSLGPEHKRTGDICYKMASHHLRLGDNDLAKPFIEQALKIFALKPYHKRELARATFKESQLLQAVGDRDAASVALDKALELRRSILPADKLDKCTAVEADFDDMVVFWCR